MNLIDSRCLQFFILYGLVFMLVQGAFENFELKRTPTICEKACIGGACIYSDCVDVQATCPGGACKFLRSKGPSCTGGGCHFVECSHATCEGGSCNFENPQNSLKYGYCNGENCYLDGEPHPTFQHGYLSS